LHALKLTFTHLVFKNFREHSPVPLFNWRGGKERGGNGKKKEEKKGIKDRKVRKGREGAEEILNNRFKTKFLDLPLIIRPIA
jgi:hypothetical protein